MRKLFRAKRWARTNQPSPHNYEPGDLSPEAHVRMAYRLLLRREPDAAGAAVWNEHVASGRYTQQFLIDALLNSDEYQSTFGIDVVKYIHGARVKWVRTLAAFDRILDIGGSSANVPEGALIELGYPHRPKRLDILDLPPDEQYWGKPKYDQSMPSDFDWGRVYYHHGSAETIGQVASLQRLRFDCIFLGQAIEHVYPKAIPGLLSWIRVHLEPGGQLILDTPNRRLTRVQCPDSLIDPDHKHEYTPSELADIVEAAGFRITRRAGMVHLPEQAATGRYAPVEFASGSPLHDDADACYLFALHAEPTGTATLTRR